MYQSMDAYSRSGRSQFGGNFGFKSQMTSAAIGIFMFVGYSICRRRFFLISRLDTQGNDELRAGRL